MVKWGRSSFTPLLLLGTQGTHDLMGVYRSGNSNKLAEASVPNTAKAVVLTVKNGHHRFKQRRGLAGGRGEGLVSEMETRRLFFFFITSVCDRSQKVEEKVAFFIPDLLMAYMF